MNGGSAYGGRGDRLTVSAWFTGPGRGWAKLDRASASTNPQLNSGSASRCVATSEMLRLQCGAVRHCTVYGVYGYESATVPEETSSSLPVPPLSLPFPSPFPSFPSPSLPFPSPRTIVFVCADTYKFFEKGLSSILTRCVAINTRYQGNV